MLYKVVGQGSEALARVPPGASADILGPLEIPYRVPGPGETPVLIASGSGAAALYLLAKASPSPGVVCVGACLTSVVRIRTGPDTWDYQRACREGPVFDAHTILWDA